jgi:hypothetical protein
MAGLTCAALVVTVAPTALERNVHAPPGPPPATTTREVHDGASTVADLRDRRLRVPQLAGDGDAGLFFPRRSAMRWKSFWSQAPPWYRTMASSAAQRTSRDPILVIAPQTTLVSDSR